ncbi:hypothetical protein M079_4745 [Bacteroides fragilis str. 3996 N(B) 6]|jgi:hypothetical protein|nr:hypothetical protein M079_4745 [Bacteroides fragilis str. 3996 N(B) 6]
MAIAIKKILLKKGINAAGKSGLDLSLMEGINLRYEHMLAFM